MTKKSDKPLLLSSSSTHSSISCGIASITTAVKKHVKTLTHPFKKTKQALSKCSASSATIIIDDDSTKSSPASANPDDSSEVEVADADPEKELGKSCFCSFLSPLLITSIRTPEENLVLANLQPDVSVQYHNGHLTHFFPYTTLKCKMKAGGIRCFQDSKDKSLTANLKHHAINCFGAEAVDNTIKGKAGVAQSASIFSLFTHQGQQPVRYSHCTHTNPEVQ
jgi:hypothetical protein